MFQAHSPLGYLLGAGISPAVTNPHYPLSRRLEGLKQIGLVSVGPTGIGIGVARRTRKEWNYSKVEEYVSQLNFPSLHETAIAQIREISGKGDVCVGVGFGNKPELVQIPERLSEIEEMRQLYHSPESLVPGLSRGDAVAVSLVHNARTSAALSVGVERDYLANINGALKKAGFNVLRLQSTATNLLDLAGAAPHVVSGECHFAIIDHLCATFVATDEQGEWIDIFHNAEAGRNGGAGLNDWFAEVAAKVASKPMILVSHSKTVLQSAALDEGPFDLDPFLDESALNGTHLATETLLIN